MLLVDMSHFFSKLFSISIAQEIDPVTNALDRVEIVGDQEPTQQEENIIGDGCHTSPSEGVHGNNTNNSDYLGVPYSGYSPTFRSDVSPSDAKNQLVS